MINDTVTSGWFGGSSGNDTITGVAQKGTGQIHIEGKAGSDIINMDYSNIDRYSHGHHVRGDNNGSNNRGGDLFNFRNLHNVDDIIVGRIEDFDLSRDHLFIDADPLSESDLARGYGTDGTYSWRIVEYDADTTDSATGTQQWILIDTGQGYAFYALEGARVTNNDGASNRDADGLNGQQEAHFVGAANGHSVTAAELANLATVGYVDPQNYIPAGETAQGGSVITDYDGDYDAALDTILGTGNGDLIAAGLNDDIVGAGGGNDRIWGGSGNDTVYAEAGDDSIYGGTGNDSLFGGSGDDLIEGGSGNDTLLGLNNNDTLIGGSGNDWLLAGNGNDSLEGGAGNDLLEGEDGNDVVYGHDGADTLVGGNGNDYLNGMNGNDRVYGGAGQDTIGSSVDNDVMNGGVDADRFDFYASQNLGNDRILDFENGLDRLAFWVVDYNDLGIQNVSGGVRISWTDGNSNDADGNDTSSVILEGLSQWQIDQNDFTFL